MKRVLLPPAVLLLVLFAAASCERTTSETPEETFPTMATIPAEFGDLEAVTTTETYPRWAQLWFQDSLGTVRVVRVQFVDGLIHQSVKTFNRQ
ncbi:MAG: hypothetical protein RBT76_02170 [candidate division Zixibacteria bacterium]|jgi:hypothetical protein|nr:hypothetical protein [candidate division Zixibacteria bacterium]